MTATKYKIGQKVRIRKDLAKHEHFDGCLIVSNMHKYAGTTKEIRGLESFNRYLLKNIDWVWTSEMFEPVKRGRPKGSKNKKKHIAHARKKVRTIEDVQVGDIVIDDDGDERKVLREEKSFMLSVINNFEIESDVFSVKSMKDWGFTLKQPEKKFKLNGEYTKEELLKKIDELTLQ